MKILALDIATKTGWAMCDNGRYSSGVFDCNAKSYGKRYSKFQNVLLTKFNFGIDNKPDILVYEKAFQKSQASNELFNGFLAITRLILCRAETKFIAVYPNALKKWATGNGKASKQDMIDAAKLLGWNPKDDNEADALLLLEYALETIKK